MSESPDLGEIRHTDDTVEIVFRRRLSHPIDKVWAALTLQERIADWFTQMTFDRLAPGEPARLTFPAPHGSAEARFVTVEPPHRLAWTWSQPDGSQSTVSFELRPDGEGCQLTLIESGLTPSQGAGNAGGWHAHLQGLDAAAGGVRTPWETIVARAKAVDVIYKARAPA